MRFTALALAPILWAGAVADAAHARDPMAADDPAPMPRIAVMSAFAPEWTALTAAVSDPETQIINGNHFVTGQLMGQDVVLVLSGISMVNAAMTTQLTLNHFDVDAIVFSGIAGGVDPGLNIGDVVVAAQWGQYLDTVRARQTADGYELPAWMSSSFPNFGMVFTLDVAVTSARQDEPEQRFWFPVDAGLLATAETMAGEVTLDACTPEGACLSEPPQIIVGGNGVSGPSFIDNAAFRQWVFDSFSAHVLDMESAAVAHVAYANQVPFIAFRSLSDLAGGGDADNEMPIFLTLAAQNAAEVVKAFLAALD